MIDSEGFDLKAISGLPIDSKSVEVDDFLLMSCVFLGAGLSLERRDGNAANIAIAIKPTIKPTIPLYLSLTFSRNGKLLFLKSGFTAFLSLSSRIDISILD